jgi:ribonuclease P protein subunit RPR2
MGKKNKGELPNPSNITNRDILQRLNFLYQASVYLDSISRKCGGPVDTAAGPSSASDSGPGPSMGMTAAGEAAPSPTASLSKATRRKRDRDQRKGRVIRAADIGQGYVRAMRLIGQKTTVKM